MSKELNKAPVDQAEAERPEVVAFRYHCTNAEGEPLPGWFYSDDAGTLGLREPLMTVAQHERITAQLHDALDESDGDRWKLRSEREAAQPAQPKEPSMSTSIDTLLKIAQQLSVLAAEVEEKLSEIASEIETAAKQVESTTAADREQLAKLKQLQSLLKDL